MIKNVVVKKEVCMITISIYYFVFLTVMVVITLTSVYCIGYTFDIGTDIPSLISGGKKSFCPCRITSSQTI